MKAVLTRPASRGFSLLECLVAVIVICVGLLGIAKMQAMGLSTTTVARQRSLASFQAASLAASMHSNRQYWANTPPTSVTYNVAVNPAIVSTDAVLSADANADIAAPNSCVGSNNGAFMCSAVQLASYDVARWVNGLSSLLPNAQATVTCQPGVGSSAVSCVIQITWSEKAVAINTQEAAQQQAVPVAQFNNPTYTLYVEP